MAVIFSERFFLILNTECERTKPSSVYGIDCALLQSVEQLLTTTDEGRVDAVVSEYRFQALQAGMIPVAVTLIKSSGSSDVVKLSSLAIVNCLMQPGIDNEQTAGTRRKFTYLKLVHSFLAGFIESFHSIHNVVYLGVAQA